MRITPLTINRPASEDASAEETRSSDAADIRPPLRDTDRASRPASLPRRGLSQWNPKFNQQLSAAQQALAYVGQLESRLQALKARLSAQLADNRNSPPQLDSDLQQFTELWQQRQTAGGGLDAQLGYSPEAPARQRFTIKGLDRKTLLAGSKENLAFALAGKGQSPMLVAVDPGLAPAEIAKRFEHAFAPAGIDVALDDQENLSFSVEESVWAAVRDTLSVKGAGIRFPSGQLVRVKAEAKADAIRPGNWSSSDTAAARRTLQEVVDALARVRQVEQKLSRALAEARLQLQTLSSATDADWAGSFAADFEALAAQPVYEVYSAIAPALASISRERVVSLLTLD